VRAWHISEEIVRTIIATALVALVTVVPSVASAAVVDASLVPDGNYTVKVEKVQDGQHMLVMMQNGVEVVLVAQGVDFSKCTPNETLKISIVKGKVPVFSAA
jgi:flagellar hook assembly protein FlgD